jgi:uridylate kinase
MKAYERVLLKLSGEALAGDKRTGFDEPTCIAVAEQVKQLVKEGIQVSIVIGGGNFWRGRTSETIDRTKADQIGMLATVMNCIYVSEIFRHVGMDTEVFTPFSCGGMSQLFSKDSVISCMKKGGVAFLAGGTGHPYFSTDTATVLRAVELDCDIILMARAVDGVYDSGPKLNPQAKKFSEIPLQEMLDKKLGVVDLTATVLCIENKMPIQLFGLSEENSIVKAAQGKSNGTKITVS